MSGFRIFWNMFRALIDFCGTKVFPSKNNVCDAPIPGGPLTTHQPAEYSWMSGNLSDIHENRAESPLYGELYQNTSPVI